MSSNKYNNTSKHWRGTSVPRAPSTSESHMQQDHARTTLQTPLDPGTIQSSARAAHDTRRYVL